MRGINYNYSNYDENEEEDKTIVKEIDDGIIAAPQTSVGDDDTIL